MLKKFLHFGIYGIFSLATIHVAQQANSMNEEDYGHFQKIPKKVAKAFSIEQKAPFKEGFQAIGQILKKDYEKNIKLISQVPLGKTFNPDLAYVFCGVMDYYRQLAEENSSSLFLPLSNSIKPTHITENVVRTSNSIFKNSIVQNLALSGFESLSQPITNKSFKDLLHSPEHSNCHGLDTTTAAVITYHAFLNPEHMSGIEIKKIIKHGNTDVIDYYLGLQNFLGKLSSGEDLIDLSGFKNDPYRTSSPKKSLRSSRLNEEPPYSKPFNFNQPNTKNIGKQNFTSRGEGFDHQEFFDPKKENFTNLWNEQPIFNSKLLIPADWGKDVKKTGKITEHDEMFLLNLKESSNQPQSSEIKFSSKQPNDDLLEKFSNPKERTNPQKFIIERNFITNFQPSKEETPIVAKKLTESKLVLLSQPTINEEENPNQKGLDNFLKKIIYHRERTDFYVESLRKEIGKYTNIQRENRELREENSFLKQRLDESASNLDEAIRANDDYKFKIGQYELERTEHVKAIELLKGKIEDADVIREELNETIEELRKQLASYQQPNKNVAITKQTSLPTYIPQSSNPLFKDKKDEKNPYIIEAPDHIVFPKKNSLNIKSNSNLSSPRSEKSETSIKRIEENLPKDNKSNQSSPKSVDSKHEEILDKPVEKSTENVQKIDDSKAKNLEVKKEENLLDLLRKQ